MPQRCGQVLPPLWHAGVTESISCFVAFLLYSHDAISLRMRCNFPVGRWASILAVSRVIPKKVRESDGPSTFSVARGIPRKSHNCFMADRFSWH